MKIKCLIFFLLSFGTVFSQQFLPIQQDSNLYNNEIIISGLSELGTTSLKNELTHKMIFGGMISDEIKSTSESKQNSFNRVGVDLNSEMEYRNMNLNFLSKPNLGIVLKGGYYVLGSARYSKDLFQLVFNGNAENIGETKDFSNTLFNYFSFQKLGFGIIDKKSKSSICINYFNVSDYFGGNFRKGKITENEDATSVLIDLNGGVRYANSSLFNKGFGVGIDLDYRFRLNINSIKSSNFQLVFKNIGLLKFTTAIQEYSVDSVYHYNGFNMSQLYGEKSVFSDSISVLDSLNIKHSTSKRMLFLPGYFQFGKIISSNVNAKWQSFYGLRLYPTLIYTPMIYIGAQYSCNEKVQLGAQISNGGFSKIRGGLYANFTLSYWSIGVGSQDVYGLISKSGFGESFLIRARCKF